MKMKLERWKPLDDAVQFAGGAIPIASRHVFTDGGLASSNPSIVGGTWAWCAVETDDDLLTQYGVPDELASHQVMYASGFVPASGFQGGSVGNNTMEIVAIVMALQALPVGWCGRLYTDSEAAVDCLFRNRRKTSFMTDGLWRRALWAFDRKTVVPVQVGGHPRVIDFQAGYRVDKERSTEDREVRLPVSIYNRWCDERCAYESRMQKEKYQQAGKIS